MLPREKLQFGFGFLGLFLIGFGIALVQPGGKEEARTLTPLRVGFWKDTGVTVATGRKIGPWMIGAGAAAIVGACWCRPR